MASAVDRERANGNWAGSASPIRTSDIPSTSLEEFHTPQSSLINEAPISTSNREEDEIVSPSSVTSPPYWVNSHGHQRNISSVSVESVLPAGAITLRDNETSDDNDRNAACWAKSVEISDYTIVNGSATNIGAFVVWNIRVETLHGSYMNIRKRYSEFDEFRNQLVLTFPGFEAAVPVIPPKSVISKFRPKFLEKRRAGLQYFLNCILLNPEFSGSPVLKEFLFA
ncbi:Phox homologous domain-containing protein [Dactylonectria macrodidyma]|uniref:Endosomal/vacuolar adapter protein YPT35 n=1 Tax=Dactylonectria macrodidyma TaxID=307937 RepID=A0A9P9F6X0_9HYPO|nr:Phox homologous domain-containing protein [Dactylonectria macrodidyma]